MNIQYKPMDSAPQDGTEIIGKYNDGKEVLMFWSERPVCMLGPINGGFQAGWATCGEGVDYNLPLDEPDFWRIRDE